MKKLIVLAACLMACSNCTPGSSLIAAQAEAQDKTVVVDRCVEGVMIVQQVDRQIQCPVGAKLEATILPIDSAIRVVVICRCPKLTPESYEMPRASND